MNANAELGWTEDQWEKIAMMSDHKGFPGSKASRKLTDRGKFLATYNAPADSSRMEDTPA